MPRLHSWSRFRRALVAALLAGGLAVPLMPASAASNAGDRWLQDTLDDSSLWFANSHNLAFVTIDPGLSGYARERRWVGVLDGRPAWVVYYVPGEIEEFEVDTHHFAGHAIAFRFSVGKTPDALTSVSVDVEPVEIQAGWLRLYHHGEQVPPGAHFLFIAFPEDIERGDARLTEVWIRYRPEPAPPAADPEGSKGDVARDTPALEEPSTAVAASPATSALTALSQAPAVPASISASPLTRVVTISAGFDFSEIARVLADSIGLEGPAESLPIAVGASSTAIPVPDLPLEIATTSLPRISAPEVVHPEAAFVEKADASEPASVGDHEPAPFFRRRRGPRSH